jgi:acetate kinase
LILDEGANARSDVRLHHTSSTIQVYCLPTNEESIIAEATAGMV